MNNSSFIKGTRRIKRRWYVVKAFYLKRECLDEDGQKQGGHSAG